MGRILQAAFELVHQGAHLRFEGLPRQPRRAGDVGGDGDEVAAPPDAVAMRRVQVVADDAPRLPRQRGAVATGPRPHEAHEPVLALEHLGEEVGLGAKVPVEATARQPGGRHDAFDADAAIPVAAEEPAGLLEDAVAGPVGVVGRVAHAFMAC
jgi:hypothetical protein